MYPRKTLVNQVIKHQTSPGNITLTGEAAKLRRLSIHHQSTVATARRTGTCHFGNVRE